MLKICDTDERNEKCRYNFGRKVLKERDDLRNL